MPALLENVRTEKGTTSSTGNWTAMRQRFQVLGITRYWIEGEPTGMVRFRCVVPHEGQKAISQQFEGEGADDFAAAEAALRRLALWKATESD
jgi:hypothetical protein